MDKYEYKEMTEQMLEYMRKGSYRKAADIADEIDWKRVRNVSMLMSVSDIYEKNKNYQKSYEILNIAYRRAEGGRKVISRLCTLALKTGNVDEAIDYYDDFLQAAPKDPNQYILRYQILRAQRAPIEQQIEALEEYKKSEYIEEWAYELAKLYQEAGMTAECLEECDDLILWFSEGQYVYKAMELKMQYKSLTPSQQNKYDRRYEKLSVETEEMPDIVSYAQEKEDSQSEDRGETTQLPVQDENPADEIHSERQTDPVKNEINEEEQGGTSPEVPQKRKLGDTMPLDEALRKLLQPEKEEKGDEEEELADLEKAISEIESVADMDMVVQIAEEKKETSGEMKEIRSRKLSAEKPLEEEQITGQMSLEDILSDWEREPVQSAWTKPETEEEADVQTLSEQEEAFLEHHDEEQERIGSGKDAEPILPEDIQRMIDEIEGVLPEEKKTMIKEEHIQKIEEPRENMGEVTESLRMDDDFEEDFLDEEDLLGEAEELEEEALFDEGEDLDKEFLEEGEDLDEGNLFDEVEELEEEALFDEGEDLDEKFFDEGDILFGEGEDVDDGGVKADLADLDEEFRINPEHDQTEDEREIPDEDDDNMDILSATTPLSRKETAKMIATGKTAPLPLDEISNMLSMDTGFIVHGRYDLETQSGIGTRAGLTEEQKKLFSYFVPVRGMSEQLVDVLEQDKNCTNRHGTSKAGNLLIIGNKGSGKTVLAVDVVKAIQKQRNIRKGKVAIVTGESLNKKKIGDIFDKLHGGALIIEKAGKMNEKTVARLNKAMEGDTGELLIVLEEQRKPLDRLLTSNREFRRKFTSRLEIPVFINDELVTFGQTYAQENGYRVDEMGILALYSKIDSLQREDHAVTVAEVKEIMDEAIGHSQRASAKKLMKRVFGKNTDEADRIILSENDFNI